MTTPTGIEIIDCGDMWPQASSVQQEQINKRAAELAQEVQE